jgi:hypothetical protein
MNRKQLIILVVVLAVLGAAGWMAQQRNKPSSGSSRTDLVIGGKLLPDFQLNDVAQIRVIQATQQLTLAKGGDIWAVKDRGDYPANFGNISELVRKFWDLKVAKPVVVSDARLAALDLVAPEKGSGTRLEFKSADGASVASVLLGASHMRESQGNPEFGGGGSWPDGRYVMVNEDLKRVALVSDPLSNVEAWPADWLNKDFIKVEKIKSIAVTSGDPTNQWKLVRETEGGSWALAGAQAPESLDSAKVASANSFLASPYFNDVLIQPDPAASGLDEARVAVLETFDGFTYTIQLGQPATDGGDYPVRVSVAASLPGERTAGADEKEEDKAKLDLEFKDRVDKLKEKLKKEQAFAPWTYAISKWTVDFLLKDRKDLLTDAKAEASPGDLPDIEAVNQPALPDFVPELAPD